MRAVAAAASVLLTATVLAIGPAVAADTRLVDFSFGTFSDATVGGRTAVTITLANPGGQTINHVAFAGGAVADGFAYNPAYPKPSGPSLPAGASFAAIFPSTGCSLTGGSTNAWASVFCDVGQFAANATISYMLVINVPLVAGDDDIWLTVSWNEGWSSTGSNADYTFATGAFTVGADNCDTATSSYFLPGEHVGLDNGGGTCQNQEASIASGQALHIQGIGGFASLGIDDGFAATCPTEIHGKCFGVTVEVSVLGGIPVLGGVQWTVTWSGIKSLSGVIHFGDDYATDPTDYTIIPFTKKFNCSLTLTTNCWVSTDASKGNAEPLFFTAIFKTPDNGKGGGFT